MCVLGHDINAVGWGATAASDAREVRDGGVVIWAWGVVVFECSLMEGGGKGIQRSYKPKLILTLFQ